MWALSPWPLWHIWLKLRHTGKERCLGIRLAHVFVRRFATWELALRRAVFEWVGLHWSHPRRCFFETPEEGGGSWGAQPFTFTCNKLSVSILVLHPENPWLLQNDIDHENSDEVLEHFIISLQTCSVQWVQCHQPNTLTDGIQMVRGPQTQGRDMSALFFHLGTL